MQQDLTSGAMGWPLQRLAQYAADLADDEGVTHGALAELLEQPLDKAVTLLSDPDPHQRFVARKIYTCALVKKPPLPTSTVLLATLLTAWPNRLENNRSALRLADSLLDIFHAVLKAHRHARIGRSAVSPLLGFIHGISTRCEVEAILCHSGPGMPVAKGLVTLYRDVFKLMDFEGEDDEFPDTGEDARRTMHAVIASLSRIGPDTVFTQDVAVARKWLDLVRRAVDHDTANLMATTITTNLFAAGWNAAACCQALHEADFMVGALTGSKSCPRTALHDRRAWRTMSAIGMRWLTGVFAELDLASAHGRPVSPWANKAMDLINESQALSGPSVAPYVLWWLWNDDDTDIVEYLATCTELTARAELTSRLDVGHRVHDMLNPHRALYCFLSSIHFDVTVLVDYLLSPDTCDAFLRFLLTYVPRLARYDGSVLSTWEAQWAREYGSFFQEESDLPAHALLPMGRSEDPPSTGVCRTLQELATQLEAMHRLGQFPYNPRPLLRRIRALDE